ncbi:MAG: tol-pal system protein YbgF, partial [Thermoanaerobaculia bacterium]
QSMKKLAAAAVVMLSIACASTNDAPEPVTVPQVAAPDPRIGELQTAMTELLDRLDVMNSRLARLEEAPAPAPAPARAAAAPVPETPAAAQPQPMQRALVGAQLAEDYRQAIMLFGRGKHAEARRAFQAVFDSESAGDLADNALFWIGETYFATADYTNAVKHYMRVVNEFSDQNKAPDALFKIALAQERTGDLALARQTLQQVIERYPYSSTASSAKAELQRIRF